MKTSAAVFFLLGAALSLFYFTWRIPMRLLDGEFPQRRFRALGCSRGITRRRGRRIASFISDLLFTLFAAIAVVIMDCGLCGGQMRYYHAIAGLIGYLAAGTLLRLAKKPLDAVLSLLLDACRGLLALLFSPLVFLNHLMLLICARIYGTISVYRADKVQRRRLNLLARSAFLPRDL